MIFDIRLEQIRKEISRILYDKWESDKKNINENKNRDSVEFFYKKINYAQSKGSAAANVKCFKRILEFVKNIFDE